MRIVFFCISLMVLFGMIFSQAMPNTDTTTYFSEGSLQIQRNLIVKPAGFVSSTTGAALEKYESIVTILVLNSGNEDKTNLKITEDISYIPPDAKFSFNVQPQMNDNYAIWSFDDLEAGEDIHIRFSVPAIISKSAFEELDVPLVEFDRPDATLEVTPSVELDSSIKISLKDAQGAGIANAFVQVTYPDGSMKLVQTDNTGDVRIIAQQLGFYAFSSPDYMTKNVQTTRVVGELPQDKEDIVPPKSSPAPSENGESLDIVKGISESILIIVLPIAVILAYLVYRYLSSPIEEEDITIPPAPATRPPMGDGVHEPTEPAGEPEVIAREQEFEEIPEIKPLTPPDTQSLLARRRNKKHTEDEELDAIDTEDEKPRNDDEVKEEQEAVGQEEPERNEDTPITEESTPIVYGDEKEYKTQRIVEEKDETAPDQTQDIDEDAIKKTIEELEQLREELKSQTEEKESDSPTVSEDEIRELEEEEPGTEINSIVQRAKDSEREKVINADIGELLDEEEEKPIFGVKRRERPKIKKMVKIVKKKTPKVSVSKKKQSPLKKTKAGRPKGSLKKAKRRVGRSKKGAVKKKSPKKPKKKGAGRPSKKKGRGRPKGSLKKKRK